MTLLTVLKNLQCILFSTTNSNIYQIEALFSRRRILSKAWCAALMVMTSLAMRISMVVKHSTSEIDHIKRSASELMSKMLFLMKRSILALSLWTPMVFLNMDPRAPSSLTHVSDRDLMTIQQPENQLTKLKQTHIFIRQSVTYILLHAVEICQQKTVKRTNHLFKCRLLVWQNNECLEKATISTLYQRL